MILFNMNNRYLKIDNICDKLLKCCKVRALINMTVGDGS